MEELEFEEWDFCRCSGCSPQDLHFPGEPWGQAASYCPWESWEYPRNRVLASCSSVLQTLLRALNIQPEQNPVPML